MKPQRRQWPRYPTLSSATLRPYWRGVGVRPRSDRALDVSLGGVGSA